MVCLYSFRLEAIASRLEGSCPQLGSYTKGCVMDFALKLRSKPTSVALVSISFLLLLVRHLLLYY